MHLITLRFISATAGPYGIRLQELTIKVMLQNIFQSKDELSLTIKDTTETKSRQLETLVEKRGSPLPSDST